MRKILSRILIAILICISLCGCDILSSPEQNVVIPTPEAIMPKDDNTSTEVKTAESFLSDVNVNQGIADFYQIELSIVNKCGAQIGMLSIIDPISEEQLNLSKIDDRNVLTLTLNWPKNENTIKWALYNSLGELCVELESDLTGMTKSANFEIVGNGDVEDVNITVE